MRLRGRGLSLLATLMGVCLTAGLLLACGSEKEQTTGGSHRDVGLSLSHSSNPDPWGNSLAFRAVSTWAHRLHVQP
jgi:hypothetical protein